MLTAEQAFNGYRVFAVAISDASHPGYRAAAVAMRVDRHGLPVEVVFRDDDLDDGRLWPEPGAAVRFGLEVGEAAARVDAVCVSSAAGTSAGLSEDVALAVKAAPSFGSGQTG